MIRIELTEEEAILVTNGLTALVHAMSVTHQVLGGQAEDKATVAMSCIHINQKLYDARQAKRAAEAN